LQTRRAGYVIVRQHTIDFKVMSSSNKKIVILICLVVIALSSCLVIGFIRRAQIDMVGYWLIDQPAHALYEASVYEFKSSGELRLVDNYAIEGISEYTVGSVLKRGKCPPQNICPPEIKCEFGNEWHSNIFQILSISGVCSDGVQRNIKIWLRSYSDPYSYHHDAVVLSVGGKWGWYHGPFYWHWTKCIDLEDCIFWE